MKMNLHFSKRILVKSFLLLFFYLGNIFAEEAGFSPWCGYSTVKMWELRDFLSNLAKEKESAGGKSELTELPGGIIFGLDICPYAISPSVRSVFRAGYSPPLSFKLHTTSLLGEEEQREVQTALTFLGLGGEYSLRNKGKMNFQGALFLGAGWGTTKEIFGISPKIQVPAKGLGVYFEICGGIRSVLSEDFSFWVNLGYRVMKIAKMKYTVDADIDGDEKYDREKGDFFLGTEDEPLEFDFGGLTITTGIEFK